MKFIEMMKKRMDWILMALACAGIASIMTLGPKMKINFAMPWLVIHISIVITVFIIVFIGGSLLEQKIMVKRFQNELKGGEKE